MPYLGELSAILAALCWTINSLSVERYGKGYSPWALNALTKVAGLVAVSLLALLLSGRIFPGATGWQWAMLLFSGILGFSLGDGFYYAALQSLGARLTLLIYSVNPVLAAILSWIFLGETLKPPRVLGILLSVAGIMWVIYADMGQTKGKGSAEKSRSVSFKGLVFAALSTLGQAAGALLSKAGMASLDPIPAAQIRLVGGVLGLGVLLTALGKWGSLPAPLREKDGRKVLGSNVLFGTLLGMVLSMLAIKTSPVAIASILMSLMPVMILPISAVFLKVKVRPREIWGALVTLLGVALLFL